MTVRNLVLVLGDQLDLKSAVFNDFDFSRDLIFMAEVFHESNQVWSHKSRIVLFLSAMRHFRDQLRKNKFPVHYVSLEDSSAASTFGEVISNVVHSTKPQKLISVEPGEWRIQRELEVVSKSLGIPIEIRPDTHFLCSKEEFKKFSTGRKILRMEFFYRMMRQKLNVLMDHGYPAGGVWNFDKENRKSFGKKGPGEIPLPVSFEPDSITKEVMALVQKKFPDHPGAMERFDWPVTRQQAKEALSDFMAKRLPGFGLHEDAIWTNKPFLYHSRLSSSMNLKLLHPKDIVDAVEKSFRNKQVGLASAEGFIRQIIGWREYVRGVYWLFMPEYVERNELGATNKLPDFYWTGKTDMNCLKQVINQTLEFGYAHHIQRLMVTGLFSLLYGVDPKKVHEWYLAVYVDAVEWVELPNTLGMSQYADGGVMASKPYVATGKYIKRMSNYCQNCIYNPDLSIGDKACPFTTLYWDFLIRHQDKLRNNNRMALQLKNLKRLNAESQKKIQSQARNIEEKFAIHTNI